MQTDFSYKCFGISCQYNEQVKENDVIRAWSMQAGEEKKKNSVVFSPPANYTDRAVAAGQRG
jgi:hypothetical protein